MSLQALVRKSTHKCIATYVKLSKKLEYVLFHLCNSGLESPNTRTRQHSMLVIPALLSLKANAVEKGAIEIIDLVSKVIRKLKDPQEVVSKTARKLIVELQKCYPYHFDTQIVASLKKDEEKNICKAILRNDEDEIQRLITQSNHAQQLSQNPYNSFKKQQEESK